MNASQKMQGVAEADRARDELYATLGQLRERLDYAQRIDDSLARTKHRIAEEKRENPLLFGAGVVTVAAVCGLAAWGVTRKIIRLFE